MGEVAPRFPTPTSLRLARGGAYVGLACGILYSFGGVVVDLLTIGPNLGTALAFGALVGMPLIFAATGFVMGILFDTCHGVLRHKD